MTSYGLMFWVQESKGTGRMRKEGEKEVKGGKGR
jgi:hypothetical protein